MRSRERKDRETHHVVDRRAQVTDVSGEVLPVADNSQPRDAARGQRVVSLVHWQRYFPLSPWLLLLLSRILNSKIVGHRKYIWHLIGAHFDL